MIQKEIDINSYNRKDTYNHFMKDCKCSTSITSTIDVTTLYDYSKRTDTKFYINFLYILSKALNSKEEYRMFYSWQDNKLFLFDKINPCHYIFHEDTETITCVYSEYFEDYERFYINCAKDIEEAKKTREYGLDSANHLDYFDASYISWLSYDSLNIELPDGYPYFAPIINWGRYKKDGDRFMMPVTVRMNHAIADGYHISMVFLKLQKEIDNLIK